jgi:hypothetical protein
MDQEGQDEQGQKKGFWRGLGEEATDRLTKRAVNSLLKKQAGKTAAQATEKIAVQGVSKLLPFLANPYVLGAIGAIIAVVALTYFIVHSTGKDKYGSQQNTNSPITTPVEP